MFDTKRYMKLMQKEEYREKMASLVKLVKEAKPAKGKDRNSFIYKGTRVYL